MNILLITKLFPSIATPFHGIFTQVFFDYYTNAFQEDNVSVIRPIAIPKNIIKTDNGYSLHPKIMQREHYNIHYPPTIGLPMNLIHLHDLPYFRTIKKFVKKTKQNPDIIHAYWLYPDGYVAVKTGEYLNKPVILHALGSDINVQMKIEKLDEKHIYALKKAKAVIVCSEKLKETLIKKFPEFSDKIKIINSAVQRDHYYQTDFQKALAQTIKKKQSGKKDIVFAGRICDDKGVREIISAAAIIKNKRTDFTIHLVGFYDSEETINRYKKMMEEKNVTDVINIVGSVPVMEYWYRIADFTILPSYSEGMPMTMLESLATGVPMIATNVGGIPEVIQDEKQGQLIEPKNSQALADAIIARMDTTVDRKSLYDSIENFDLSVQTNKLKQLYLQYS